MASLASANILAEMLGEVAEGEMTMSGQLSQLSEACLRWAQISPDQIRPSYDRFEQARQAVRRNAGSGEWTELKEAALKLKEVFKAA